MEISFKRFLSLALAFLMVLSNVPVQAFATETGGECTHPDQIVTSTATCTEAGVATTTCGSCGTVLATVDAEATDHNFVDGVCTVEGCGAEDPNYVVPETPTEAPVAPIDENPEAPTEDPNGEGTQTCDHQWKGYFGEYKCSECEAAYPNVKPFTITVVTEGVTFDSVHVNYMCRCEGCACNIDTGISFGASSGWTNTFQIPDFCSEHKFMGGFSVGGQNATLGDEVVLTEGGTYSYTYTFKVDNQKNLELALAAGGTVANLTSGTFTQNVTEYLADGYKVVMDDNGNYTVVQISYVAQIGDQKYETLQAAIDVAEEATVKLLKDIELTETLTIAKGKKVTLDLNGKTVSMVKTGEITASHTMILNKGELTITDSGENGKLSYKFDGTANKQWAYAVTTISNQQGKLTVKGGTIESQSLSTNSKGDSTYVYKFTVDNLTNGNGGDATVKVEGGKITAAKGGPIRGFANSTTCTNTIEITGGEIEGQVWMQDPNTSANKGVMSITGGTIKPNAVGVDAVYFDGQGDASAFSLNIGGSAVIEGTVNLTDDGVAVKAITGGSFTTDVSAYVADGYELKDGTVTEKTPVAKIGDQGYETLQAAVDAVVENAVIVVNKDIELTETLTIAKGKKVTLDLNGKTISSTHGTDYAMIHVENGAALTVKDSAEGGKITCAAGGNNTGAAVWVEGALVLESGTIELTETWNLGFAVDLRPNAWGTAHTAPATFVMNGGTVKSADTAVRVASNSSDSYEELGVSFTMNGGTIDSTWDAIFVQHLYTGDLDVVVKNGKITGTNSVVRIYGGAGSDVDIDIQGGTFVGEMKVADAYANADAITITGGSFTTDVSAYVADGYELKDGTVTEKPAVATIGAQGYKSLKAAINAVQNGETIVLTADCAETVTINKSDVAFTIDGAEKTYTGQFKLNIGQTVTIKNVNFVHIGDAEHDFIKNEGSPTGKNYNCTLTVENCDFTGNGKDNVVAVRQVHPTALTITGGTATGLHSLAQNTGGQKVTVDGVTVTDSKSGIALGGVRAATVKNSTITTDEYGIRVDAATANAVIDVESNKITAFIPVVVRKATANDVSLTVSGTNTMNASNTDGLWCAIGTNEYEENGTMPTDPTGKVTLTLNDEGLSMGGAYGYYVEPVAKVGDTEYGYIDEAIAAWANNTTLTLLADVTLSDVITLSSQEHHYLALGTYTMTAASGKNAIEIKSYGRADRKETGALTITADATNPGGINAGTKACIYYKYDAALANNQCDRPIIYIKSGVFTGSSYSGISCSGHNKDQDKCATFDISGGTFNCGLNLTKAKLIISGGTFNSSVSCTGGSTSIRQISGGKFKSWQFMTADANNKFWVGTSKANYDVGCYVDDEGYLVVGGDVITEAGDKFEAYSANYSGWSGYLQYSSAANNGLYYTSAAEALADNNKTNGSVTVYVDVLDMNGISYKGTIVAADTAMRIMNAPAGLKVVDTNGNTLHIDSNGDLFIATAQIGNDYYASLADAAKAIATDGSDTTIKILSDIELTESIEFKYGTGKVTFTADEPVTIKQAKNGLDLLFVDGKAANIVVEENVTFQISDNAAGMNMYYGPSLTLNGTITGGANWGCLYLFNGTHVVGETGVLSVGRTQLGFNDLTVYGKMDTNYLLVEKAAFTADGASIDANVIYDNNNGGQRYGASKFTIKNESEVKTSKLTLNHADTELTIDLSSKLEATEIVGGGKIIIDAAGYTAGTESPIVGNASAFTGTIEVINNNDLKAEIDANGNIVLKEKVYVAQIQGGKKYETLAEAVAAVKEGETIIILAGERSEGTIKLPATLKNVTFKGDNGAVLKDMTIMASDGNSYSYVGLTFDGITFDNSRISLTGWRNGEETIKDLTVTNCVFKNLNDTTNSAPVHINKDAAEAVENFTFTNNVIDGATGGSKSGVYAQVTGKTIITGNTINNVSFRPYVVQVTTDDGIADEFIVTGNTFSGSAAGRAQGLGNNAEGTDTVKLVVSENIFKGITSSQQICYWNFNAETTTADLSKNYYDIDILANPNKIYYNSAAQNAEDLIAMGVYPYYADEAKTQLVVAPAIMVTYADGTVEYFDDMREAVPHTTNCPELEGATITLLKDMSGLGMRFMENGMVFDLNGHTYTLTGGTGSKGTETSAFQIRPEVTETATIKNGTVKLAEGVQICWIFNSYATDFIVEDVTVDCTNMAWGYGESCRVAVCRSGDNVQFTGTTKIENFDFNVSGNIVLVGGTMSIGDNVVLGGTIKLDAGATLTAREGLEVVTVDGYKVVYNNGVYSTVEVVATIGNVGYASLAEAFKAAKSGDEVKILKAGTYALSTSGKNITITGAVDGVVFDNIGAKNMGGASVTFNNVTFNYTNANYTGLQHSGDLVYNNCTINGQPFLYGNSETFNNCTFNQTSSDAYNVWTYGAKQVTFNECTFNSAGKSLLIYAEDADIFNNVTVTKSTFNASAAVDGKAAIEMDSSLTAGINLIISETTATGFGTGNVSGNSLWNNKKGNTTEANNDITVKVGNETVLAPKTLVAEVNGVKYTDLREAMVATKAGQTLTMLADVDLAGVEWKPVDFNAIFDGNDHTISNLVVNGGNASSQGLFGTTKNGEIKNLTIHNAKVTGRLNVGVVAGQPYTSKYTNIKVTGHVEVEGFSYVGGVGGKNAYADWTDITVDVDSSSYVKATSTENGKSYRTYVGGVVGFNGEGSHTFKNVSSNIKVIGDVCDIGGLFGIAHYGNNFENVTFTGSVEAPEGAFQVGGIAGTWHNQPGYTVTFNNVTSTGNVTVGSETVTGNIVGEAYNADNTTPENSGSLVIDNIAVWPEVAEVNGKIYANLQDAINVGGTVKLLQSITLAEGVTIPADKTVTLDLNGKTISQTKAQTAGYQMILNDGNLTIMDSVGGGKISYTDSGNGGEYISDTIYNRGTLVINGGTIENLSSATVATNGYPHAVDTYSGIRDTSVTINGGTIHCAEYSAIRMFCVSATYKADLVINGGTIKGAVDMQNGTKDAALGSLTITGGTFETTKNTNNIRFANWNGGATEYGITAEIKGGTFYGGISTQYVPAAANWNSKILSGGKYSVAPNKNLLAEGHKFEYDGDWYTVVAVAVASVNGVDYTTLTAAFEAAQNGGTIYLKGDVKETVSVPSGRKATLEMKGYTLTGSILAPNAELTIQNGSIVNNNKQVSALEINAGKLTLTNVDISSARHALRIDGAVEVTIDGGEYKTIATKGVTQHALNVSGAANVTIKSGTFTGPKSTNSDSGAAVNVQSGATVTIEGGSFSGGKNSTLASAGTLTVTGGTFDQDPSAYVARGFEAVKNTENTYDVVKTLAGKGTETEPFEISTVEELILFRDSVNEGETRFNAPGVYVALTADIDLKGATWERGIGDGINATFDGIFDGKNFTIKNLNMAPTADRDKYFCGGLFGYTFGAVVIKNLVLENITVTAQGEGHNVGALVGFANNNGGKLNVSNVTVKNVTITAPNAYGVGAIVGYSYRDMGTIENCSVDGATITGYSFVGGITGYSYNGALINNCSVKNATITATSQGAGGIAGLVQGNTEVTNNTVADTTVSAAEANWGYVIGEVSAEGVLVKNNNAAEPQVGGNYADGKAVQAKIGDKYYTTFAKAYEAAQAGETITLLAPVVVAAGETLTLDKDVTIEYTSAVAGEDMITNKGTLVIDGATLVYTNTDTTASNVTVSTISCEPGSTLEVKSGVVKNDSANNGAKGIYAYAIDLLTNGSLGDVTATISGGEVISTNYMAIRQFNNGTACMNTLNVTGGKIYGAKRAIQVHMDNIAAYTTISGGTIEGGDYALCFFANNANMAVSGGKFIGSVYSAANGFISGGTFDEAVYEDYCAEGYIPVDNGNGTYGVKLGTFVAQIGEKKFESVTEAFAAAQNGDEVEILTAGTYAVPTGKNITITGAVDGVVFDNIGAHNMAGASVTFNNVTFDYYPNVNYTGLQHSGNLVYNGCTFNGQVFLYGQSETFNKCTFNQNSADAYNVWTYGAQEVAFNECTFNSVGKSVLVYAESANITNDVTITDSIFNASAAVEGKAAIEIDTSLTSGAELNISNSTATGFGTGNVSGNSLWNNKKDNKTEANNDITVVVDGNTVLAPETLVADVNGVKYISFQDAIDAAVAGDNTIKLLVDSDEDVTIKQTEGVNIVIDGGNHVYSGTMKVDGMGRSAGEEKLTIQNVNFVTDKAGHYFIDANAAYHGQNYNYAHNFTVKGSSFAATGAAVDSAVAMRIRQGFGIAIEDVETKNLHSLLQAYGNNGITINDVIVNGKNGIAVGTSTGVKITNADITATGYGIRADGTAASDMTVKNANINAKMPIVVRKNTGTGYQLTLDGTNTLTAGNADGYQVIFTKDDDGTYVGPDVEFILNGAEGLKVFPMTLTAADVKLDGVLTYNGTEQTQNFVATNGATFTVTDNTGKNAGKYTATITGTGNYIGTVTVEWTIAQKAATITVADQTMVAGNNIPAPAQVTYEGVVYGDKLNHGTPMIVWTGSVIGAPGTYDIVVELGVNPNYDVTVVNGKLTVEECVLTVNGISFNSWDDAMETINANTGYNKTVEIVLLDNVDSGNNGFNPNGTVNVDLNGFNWTAHWLGLQYNTVVTVTNSAANEATVITTGNDNRLVLGANSVINLTANVAFDGTLQMNNGAKDTTGYFQINGKNIIGEKDSLFVDNANSTVRVTMKNAYMDITTIYGKLMLTENWTNKAGQTIKLGSGTSITVPAGVTLTLDPTTALTNNGVINGEGAIAVGSAAHLQQILTETEVAIIKLNAVINSDVAAKRDVTLDLNCKLLRGNVSGNVTIIDSTVDEEVAKDYYWAGTVQGTLADTVVVKAGTYDTDVTDNCAPGYIAVPNANNTWTVMRGCMTVDGVPYDTWSDALADIKDGVENIVLYADVQYIDDSNKTQTQFPANSNITLDLNGHKLEIKGTVNVMSGSTLNVVGKGDSALTMLHKGWPIAMANGNTVKIADTVKFEGGIQMNNQAKSNYYLGDKCLFGVSEDAIFQTTGDSNYVVVKFADGVMDLTLDAGHLTLTENLETLADQKITINVGAPGKADSILTIPTGVTLTLDAQTVVTNNGIINGVGTLEVATAEHLQLALNSDVKNVKLAAEITSDSVFNVPADREALTIDLAGYDVKGAGLTVNSDVTVIDSTVADAATIDEFRKAGHVTGTITVDAGELVLKAGTYDQDVAAYVEEGSVSYNNNDGTWTVLHNIVAQNINTGALYSTVDEAMFAAKSGETVKMLVNSETNMLMVPAGVKLDLNGKTLTAAYAIVSFGHVIDSTDGNGGIKISSNAANARTSLMADNEHFPIYDSANGCYRFFHTYSSRNFIRIRGALKGTEANTAVFYYTISFTNTKAYDLLMEDGHNVDVNIYLKWSDFDEPAAFRVSDELLASYAEKAKNQLNNGSAEVKATLDFVVKGLQNMEAGEYLTGYAEMTATGTGAIRTTESRTYKVPATE